MTTTTTAMQAERVFLRPEVKIEPLACRWHAWSHLMAPAQLGMHLAFRTQPLLRSFLADLAVHVQASSDPALFGGPFVSLTEADVPAVRQLIEDTQREAAPLIEFAEDFRRLDALLHEKATGYSLNEHYRALPPSLQGLVELQYDLNHHPGIRLLERLLYAEDWTAPTRQICLQPVAEAQRSFFMSTPRLQTPDNLSWPMDFSDERLDVLARSRTQPQSLDEMERIFEITEAQRSVFRSFFTSDAPATGDATHYTGDAVRMRYFGHACVLFQTAATSILFDPYFSVEPGSDGRLTIHDLPDVIDVVVLTHAHQDHFSPEMLLQIRHRVRRVLIPPHNHGSLADPSMKLILNQLGFNDVCVLDLLEQTAIPDGTITGLPFAGEHADLGIYSKHGISLKLKDRHFVFLVDSDGRDAMLYRKVGKLIGRIDVLFIGMECAGAPLNWLYGPLLGSPVSRRNNESRRLSGSDCERAISIAGELRPARVFVYAMGQEPWMRYIMGLQYEPDSVQLTESDRFIAHCEQQIGIPAERLYLSREVVF